MRAQRTFEKVLARETAKALIDAGYFISIDIGEDTLAISLSRNVNDLLSVMFQTDDELMCVYDRAGNYLGWVRFVYGNDGWDVINDYTTNLEPILEKVNLLADRLEEGDFEITFPAKS